MHIVNYDDEPATAKLMHEYHHEIYLSDPRKCDVSKLKTVIRHPIKKIK